MTDTATRFSLHITGMHCGGCVRRVTAALAKVPGVVVDTVDVGVAKGSFESAETDLDAVLVALRAAGYPAEAAVS